MSCRGGMGNSPISLPSNKAYIKSQNLRLESVTVDASIFAKIKES